VTVEEGLRRAVMKQLGMRHVHHRAMAMQIVLGQLIMAQLVAVSYTVYILPLLLGIFLFSKHGSRYACFTLSRTRCGDFYHKGYPTALPMQTIGKALMQSK